MDLEWRAALPGACRTSSLPLELRPPSAFRLCAARPLGGWQKALSRPSVAGRARGPGHGLPGGRLYRALLSTQLSEKSVSSGVVIS